MKNRAVILARVSSKDQEDGYSLDSQLKLLQEYCSRNELSVVREFKIAETASKTQMRKTFQALLDFISHENITHLTIEKTDRLTRNTHDAVLIDDWLEADETRRLHAVKENLLLHKNAKSDVKFMWNIYVAVAKKYTDNLREEAMKGWAEKLAQGWMPGVPPPGYINIEENRRRIQVPDPVKASLMRRMFELYLDPSQTILTITKEMYVLGFRTRGNRPLVKSYVGKCLANPFYVGVIQFNGKEYPGAQEPIISRELFEKVQTKLRGNRPMRMRVHNPLFKNLVTCETCGKLVTWQLQKGRYYGACQRTAEACRGKKLIREDIVEELIV